MFKASIYGLRSALLLVDFRRSSVSQDLFGRHIVWRHNKAHQEIMALCTNQSMTGLDACNIIGGHVYSSLLSVQEDCLQ